MSPAAPKLGAVDGLKLPIEVDGWLIGEEDLLLWALLTDPVYMPEMLWKDPINRDYSGCYRVRDYQYQMNRCEENFAIFACGRSVGKTEGEKVHAQIHGIKSEGENLLLTAPELIHLLPVTDAIEDNIRNSRLLQDSLDVNNGRTGFTHRPFGVNYKDGTKVVGRIPKLTGPQPLDAKVLTPRGWALMANVHEGDLVIGSSGHPIEVIRTVEYEEPQEVFRVEFSDGSSTECDANHEWLVSLPKQPKEWVYKSTAEIAEGIGTKGAAGSVKARWQIQPSPVCHFDPVELPIDPYVLGVLLGDGSFATHSIFLTCHDEGILDELRKRLPEEVSIVDTPNRKGKYRLTRGAWGGRRRNPLITGLRDLGLLGAACETKFIPEIYLRASVEDRLSLLQGLVDTDGTVSKEGKVSFSSKNKGLCEGVAALTRSLGGWASIRPHISKPYVQKLNGEDWQNPGGSFWRTVIVLQAMPPVLLARKAQRLRPRRVPRVRSIVAVHNVGKKLVKCFRLGDGDHQYLTDDFLLCVQTGVKGQHQPFLIVEEGQDYPEKGWKEVEETINFDAVDKDGKPRFRFWVYGVHSGDRKSGFSERAKSQQWKKIQVTRLMRPDWGKEAKERATESYGGTSSGDYRRNILGEPGDAASAYFVTARLLSCVDQKVERGNELGSDYNTKEYLHQRFRAEELDEMEMRISQALDLPSNYQSVYGGVDVGLNRSPTVISLFTETIVGKKLRLKLFRRFTLERFRSKQIREALYAIDMHYGGSLMQIGVDSTGLGLPIMQEIEDDEVCPPHLMQVIRGYFFGSKVPIGVSPEQVYKDDRGVLRDQYGAMVKEERLPDGSVRFIVYAPFITASTRYLAEWVDSGFLLLPFDTDITTDMLGETKERVDRIQTASEGGNAIRKGDLFHILDSFRAMAMAYHATDIEEQIAVPAQRPVLDTVM